VIPDQRLEETGDAVGGLLSVPRAIEDRRVKDRLSFDDKGILVGPVADLSACGPIALNYVARHKH
jgi:hypothetical protein